METVSAFTLEVRPDNIAVITIDAPGEKMNTLKAEFASEVRGIIRQIRDNKELRGAVFISAKADNFIAGADINMIARCHSAQEAEALARQGLQIMAEIHGLSIPVIAAIHGAAWAAALNWRWPATGGYAAMTIKPGLASRKYSWGCCPALAELSVYHD